MSVPDFQQSFAVFDKDGCLVEWNADFVQEFSVAAPLIKIGASFQDIVSLVYANPGDSAPDLSMDAAQLASHREDVLGNFGKNRQFQYRRGDRVFHVRESLTQSGGIHRLARDV